MNNFRKTLITSFVFSSFSILLTYNVQETGRSVVGLGCSYLDPITIDIVAFVIGIFLVADGFHRIWEHKNDRVMKQFTRIIRISIGFGLLTLHLMQFAYK